MGCGNSTQGQNDLNEGNKPVLSAVPDGGGDQETAEDVPALEKGIELLGDEKMDFSRRALIVPRVPDRMQIVNFQELEATFADALLLGEGGFGVVCQVKWKGVWIAVKRLAMTKKNTIVGDFIREVTVLATMSHPNIVKLVGVSCDDLNRCLLYELMAGGSLADRISLSAVDTALTLIGSTDEEAALNVLIPFPWMDRFVVVLDGCIGLACLHECTLLHCDIKTENILIRESGRAAVADFGLSRSLSGAEAGGSMGYTPGYADPYWKVDRKYTTASDIYAMGVVILQVITGLSAHALETVTKSVRDDDQLVSRIVKRYLHKPAEWPPSVATEFARLGCRCMTFNPVDRPTISEILDSFSEIGMMPECLQSCPQLKVVNDSGAPDLKHAVDPRSWGSNLRKNLEEFEGNRRRHEKEKKETSDRAGETKGEEKPAQSDNDSSNPKSQLQIQGSANRLKNIQLSTKVMYTQEEAEEAERLEGPKKNRRASRGAELNAPGAKVKPVPAHLKKQINKKKMDRFGLPTSPRGFDDGCSKTALMEEGQGHPALG